MFLSRLNVKFHNQLFLIFFFLFVSCSFSQEMKIGDHLLTFTEPNNATPLQLNQPNVIATWQMKDSGDVFMLYANTFPNNLKIDEPGIIEGIEETTGAKTQNFTDFQSDKLLFREGTADIPALKGFKLYTSYWWKDGIFIKVQGRFNETQADASIATFRSFLSDLNVIHQNKIISVNEKKKSNVDLHEISKKLGGISFLILIGLVVYVASKKRKNNSNEN